MKLFLSPLLRNTLLALISCSVLVIICYWFVDKPVVFWAAQHQLRHYQVLYYFAHIPNVILGTVLLAYLYLASVFCYRPFYLQERILCAMANSLVIGEFIKSNLKSIFGRYWPDTWTHNNLSLLHDNAYGFNWLYIKSTAQSFPSGHATAIFVTATILWLFYPRLRWLAILLSVVVLISQALMYYHFVGDLIAGAFLGTIVAVFTIKISGLQPLSFRKPNV